MALFPIAASVSFGIFFTKPIAYYHYLVWAVTIMLVYPFFWGLKEPPKQYIGSKELAKMLNK